MHAHDNEVEAMFGWHAHARHLTPLLVVANAQMGTSIAGVHAQNYDEKDLERRAKAQTAASGPGPG